MSAFSRPHTFRSLSDVNVVSHRGRRPAAHTLPALSEANVHAGIGAVVRAHLPDLDVPHGKSTGIFWTGRAHYSFNTDMRVDALVRYDPGQIS